MGIALGANPMGHDGSNRNCNGERERGVECRN